MLLKVDQDRVDEKIAELEKCMIQIGERSMSAFGGSVAWDTWDGVGCKQVNESTSQRVNERKHSITQHSEEFSTWQLKAGGKGWRESNHFSAVSPGSESECAPPQVQLDFDSWKHKAPVLGTGFDGGIMWHVHHPWVISQWHRGGRCGCSGHEGRPRVAYESAPWRIRKDSEKLLRSNSTLCWIHMFQTFRSFWGVLYSICSNIYIYSNIVIYNIVKSVHSSGYDIQYNHD